MISVYVKPYPDELMYSWINRLAKANGLSLREFCNAYLGLAGRINSGLKYDIPALFPMLSRQIIQPLDLQELYMSVMTLAAESVRMSRFNITKYVNNSFQPAGKLNPRAYPLYQNAYVCPKCMEEDIKQYGEAYLHRAHHLNDVCVCYKHKTPLLKYDGTRYCSRSCNNSLNNHGFPVHREHTMDFDMNDYKEVPVVPSRKSAVAYAKYVNEILQSGVVADSHKVTFIILTKMEQLNLSNKQFFEKLRRWKYADLFNDFDGLRKTIYFGREYNKIEIFLYLMFLFPDPADAIVALKEHGSGLSRCVCPECGTVYLSVPHNRWPCPKCTSQMSDQGLFELLVSIVGDGKYIPLTPFQSMTNMVVFRNTITGEEKAIRAQSFLYRGTTFYGLNTITYERAYNAYLHFVSEMGTAYVPYGYKYDGVDLGRWFFHQRKLEKEGKLSPVIKEMLLRANPEFFSIVPKKMISSKAKKTYDKIWNDKYNACLDYIEQTGSLYIPNKTVYKKYNIGSWAAVQRGLERKGKLLSERKQKLLEMDPEFFTHGALKRHMQEVKANNDEVWDYKSGLLRQYIQEKGTFFVRQDTLYNEEKLGTWVNTQRSLEKQGKLLSERKAKLLEIDPDFFSSEVITKRKIENQSHAAFDLRWDQKCALYKQYIDEKGDPYIPNNEDYHNAALGLWVATQRQYGRKGIISPERRQKLIELDPYFFDEKVFRERVLKHMSEINKHKK